MWSLAWPWALLALPLPLLVRKLLPEATGLAEAGLKVPSLGEFSTLKDRKGREQVFNWRFWVAAIAALTMQCNASFMTLPSNGASSFTRNAPMRTI